MGIDYEAYASILKVLSDPQRLKIIDMLSCGEKCACELLDYFDFSQPTLSYHMKLLIGCGLVNGRKAAQWNHYSLNRNKFNQVMMFLMTISTETEECICYTGIKSVNDNEPREKGQKCCS